MAAPTLEEIMIETEIDLELLDRCIAALESGTYIQRCGRLHTNEGYCALGVFVEVAYGSGIWVRSKIAEVYGYSFPGDRSPSAYYTTDIDAGLARRLGISYRNPVLEIDQAQIHCWNDDDKTFEEIATLMRAYKQIYLDKQQA